MFGWSIFKVKKKYKKLCNRGDVNLVNLEKEEVLMELSVCVEDIIQNQQYVRMYYPLDEEIRNKGQLTLIDPKYIKYFSNVLNYIKEIMEGIESVNNDVIPDKDVIVKRLETKLKYMNEEDIQTMSMIIMSRMTLVNLTKNDLIKLIWELIDRVINATVGDKVRRYRRQTLLRLNTVAFRTELAVKSEHK